jgi:predicted PhzF superfamily epimerase YddE/YHI9
MTDSDELPVTVLRVFTDEGGNYGNALGVVDGALVGRDDRQRVAHGLGFSETIFIDDHATGELRIFTPSAELPLAGHPLVGAAWFLAAERRGGAGSGTAAGSTENTPDLELRPPGGLVRAWIDGDGRTWIEAPLGTLPDWTLVELASPAAIDDLTGPLQPDHDHVVYWAWIGSGVMRVRCFAPRFGIFEDEATGSAALRLTALLDQPVEIHQGRGSRLSGRPISAGAAAVGGLVVKDPPLPLP